MGRAAIFLDRDGVLNAAHAGPDGRPRPPRDLLELALLPGAVEACARLRSAGFALVGVTNQPDIARGTARLACVEAMNREVAAACGLDAIEMCPHDDADGCACRKPLPGLILGAAARLGLDPARSWMVGDRWRDVEAGQAAGCRTLLVGPGWPERLPRRPPDAALPGLPEAAQHILAEAPACVPW
jgi:D-glycero-D-manno-heptose 1,7-bisphosphate phosphatase